MIHKADPQGATKAYDHRLHQMQWQTASADEKQCKLADNFVLFL
jgi:hypothetical protein